MAEKNVEKEAREEAQELVEDLQNDQRMKLIAKQLASVSATEKEITKIVKGERDDSYSIQSEIDNHFKNKSKDNCC